MSNQNLPGLSPEGIVLRPRIEQLFLKACQYPVVVVEAGSGYGKTSEWKAFLKKQNIEYYWMQMTKLENLPEKFWETYVETVSRHDLSLALRMFRLGFPYSEEQLKQAIQGLADKLHVSEYGYLIIDDYHRIRNDEVKDFIDSMMHLKLTDMHIILLTRERLDLDYKWMQSEQQLFEITTKDLRFTEAEMQQYFRHKELAFTSQMEKYLYEATEGWPIALSLLAEQYQKNPEEMDYTVRMTEAQIFRILERELYVKYERVIQKFFVSLSLPELQEFDESLIRLLAGSQYEICKSYLERNMFILYDAETKLYHVHQMFLNFLKTKQVFMEEGERRWVFSQAARWAQRGGHNLQAVSYYQKCGAYDEMFQVILHYDTELRPHETAEYFLEILEQLPAAYREENPWTTLVSASLHAQETRYEKSRQLFVQLIDELEKGDREDKRQLLGEAYLGLGHVARMMRDFRLVEYYQLARQYLPDGSVLYNRKVRYINTSTALEIGPEGQTDLAKMTAALRKGMPYAVSVMHGAGYGAEYLAAGEEAFFKGDLRTARKHLIEAASRGKEMEQTDIVCNAYYLQVRISMAEGDAAAMFGYRDACREYYARIEKEQKFHLPDLIEGWIWSKLQIPEYIPYWMRSDSLYRRDQLTHNIGRDQIIRAIYLQQTKKYYEALALLERMERISRQKDSGLLIMANNIVRSICYYRLEQMPAAIRALRAAWQLSQKNQIIIHFVEMGNDMRSLLYAIRAEETGIPQEWQSMIYKKSSSYAKKVLAVTGQVRKELAVTEKIPEYDLTDKELELLRSLCQGLTREELAQSHELSINTVKSRLKSIYCKLGAVNSIDAVRIATRKGLII